MVARSGYCEMNIQDKRIWNASDTYATARFARPDGTVDQSYNSGYPIMVNKNVADELAYRMAAALNEPGPSPAPSEDIFDSIGHARETGRASFIMGRALLQGQRSTGLNLN
jgi:hypothetical protein